MLRGPFFDEAIYFAFNATFTTKIYKNWSRNIKKQNLKVLDVLKVYLGGIYFVFFPNHLKQLLVREDSPKAISAEESVS